MIEALLKEQKSFFRTGRTKDIDFRIKTLIELKKGIKKYEEPLLKALKKDLGKPYFEGYATEVGYVLETISRTIKKLKNWSRDIKVRGHISQLFTKNYIRYEPYGTVLIIGPFNYPFQLVIEPLIGAISAGNTVVIKPSEFAVNTEKVLKKLIEEVFTKKYVSLVTGDKEITSKLINSEFDYIFFTGSTTVGKVVMEAASKKLIPITLELGGKSPAIVHSDANLKITAKRVVWGKLINTGQTCIAPDYILVHESIKDKFIEEVKKTIESFYTKDARLSNDYGHIINKKHFERLVELINAEKVVYGGRYDKELLYIEPTIMDNVTLNDAVMGEEVFGPLIPVISYNNLNDAKEIIYRYDKPLALYIFSESKKIQDYFINHISFGGGCINDTISHVISPSLPFGGVGTSGTGQYHGKYSFELFSHKKSIANKSTKIDIKLIYPPYNKRVELIKRIMK